MLQTFGFMDLGAPELLIILFIALLLFGSKKLPELSRGLGESMHELRKGMSGNVDEKKKDTPRENGNS
jgi:sec-independent protein translocase protein TatA